MEGLSIGRSAHWAPRKWNHSWADRSRGSRDCAGIEVALRSVCSLRGFAHIVGLVSQRVDLRMDTRDSLLPAPGGSIGFHQSYFSADPSLAISFQFRNSAN